MIHPTRPGAAKASRRARRPHRTERPDYVESEPLSGSPRGPAVAVQISPVCLSIRPSELPLRARGASSSCPRTKSMRLRPRALVFLPFFEMHKSFFPSSFSAARPPNKVVTSSLDAFLPSLFPSLRLTPRRTHRPQMSSLRLPPSRLSTLLTLSIASRCNGSVHTCSKLKACQAFPLKRDYLLN